MKLDEQPDMAQMKANNLITEYVNSSFMSANERFNSAMVFESQLDEQGMMQKREDKKIEKLIGERSIIEMEQEEEEKEGGSKEDEGQMELDNVNQHECMRNIKRCIDRMVELFGKESWDKSRKDMPQFMQALNTEVRRPDTHINVKIFILKILINK